MLSSLIRAMTALAGAALLGAYVYAPYSVLGAFSDAIERRDAFALSIRVHWPSVRAGLKEDIRAVLTSRMAGSGGTGLIGAAIGKGMQPQINRTVDALVTPTFLEATLNGSVERGQVPGWDGDPSRFRRPEVDWAFFSGPTSFRTVLRWPNKRSADEEVMVQMDLRNFKWTITRITVPDEVLERAIRHL